MNKSKIGQQVENKHCVICALPWNMGLVHNSNQGWVYDMTVS